MVCGFGWEKTSGWRGPKKRVRMGTNLNFKISEVVVGSNKKCKRFCFQDMVGEWIRSEMAKGWLEGIKANLGLGVKEGDVGIHGVDHIGRLEWLWGIKQVPADMIGRVALMPFQIQEPEGRERIRNYHTWCIFAEKEKPISCCDLRAFSILVLISKINSPLS